MIIIERTITVKNDKATLDSPIYLHVGDGDITCLFTINEMGKVARFGSIGKDGNKINIIDNNDIDYGRIRVFKPDETLAYTDDRSEIIDGKLQVILSAEWMDKVTEAGTHQLQIHLYDNKNEEKNRFTIPPIDIHVLPLVGSNTSLIDEAMVGYALLDQLSLEEETFIDGLYNKTEWQMGDIITQGKLNKIENALYQISTTDEEHEHPEYLTHIPDEYVTEYEMTVELNKKANNHHIHEGYLTSVPDYYAKKSDVEAKNYATQSFVSNYYVKKEDLPVIPQLISAFTNDKGYLTNIPANYVTTDKLLQLNYTTYNEVLALVQQYGGSGGTTSGGTTSGEGLDPTLFVTKVEFNTKLDAKLNKTELPANVSVFTNDAGYVTNVELSNKAYITKAQIPTDLTYYDNSAANFANMDYVDTKVTEALAGEFIDISLYAKIEDVNNKDTELELLIGTKADEGHNHDDRYITEHQDLSSYPTRTEINNVLGGYSPVDHGHTGYASVTALETVEAEVTSMRTEVDNMTSEVTNIIESEISNINTSLENKADKAEIQGMVTSNTVREIRVVTVLPEKEEDGVLYIVLMA